MMKNIEKLLLLSFLYSSGKSTNGLDAIYHKCLEENEKVAELIHSVSEDLFLGEKGKRLYEKGKAIYEDLMKNPNLVSELPDLVNDYLYDVSGGRLTKEKLSNTLVLAPSEFSSISKDFYNDALSFYKDYYKAMIMTLLIFSGKQGVERLETCDSDDLFDWLLYFNNIRIPLASKDIITWVIFRSKQNIYDNGYRIQYYQGAREFNRLASGDGVVKYGPYLFGMRSDSSTKNSAVVFGMGNIVSVIGDFTSHMDKAEIYFQLPRVEKINSNDFKENPHDTICNYIGKENVNYCISPEQYLGLCRAYSSLKDKKVQKKCPICNAPLSGGNAICPRHCGSL